MENLKLIIFDLDGTLVDSEVVYRRGWSEVLKGYEHHVDESEFEVMRGMGTAHNNQIIKEYLGSDELVDEARLLREKYYFEALKKGEVELKEGAVELIETVRGEGFKLAVATSSYRKRGEATLRKLGLLEYFDYTVFGDEVSQSKPHPEIYETVLAHFGVSADDAVAIEDSPSGLKSALGAGLRVYYVPEVEMDLSDVEGEFTKYDSLAEVKREIVR